MTIVKRFASVVHLSIKNGIPMQKVCVPIQISPQIIYNVMLLVARIISMSLHNCIIQINLETKPTVSFYTFQFTPCIACAAKNYSTRKTGVSTK